MLTPPLMMSMDEFIPRSKWGASLPKKLAPAMRTPVWTVAFIYTDTENCTTQEECSKALQRLQRFHTSQGMYDIPYNFILGGDLNVYEGRGWNTTVPVPWQIENLPCSSLVVARIGPMQDDHIKQGEDFVRGYDVIKFGHLKKFIHPSFELRLIYFNWNKHEVVHDFHCEKPRPSFVKELMRKQRDFLRFIRQP